MTKINFYVDGYNFYHSVLEPFGKEGKNFKWLDLKKLCSNIIPGTILNPEINIVRFFTANAGYDNQPTSDQKNYFDALRTTGVEIHRGRFQFSYHMMKICYPCTYRPPLTHEPQPLPTHVKVQKRQEKQTDVNFSVQLVTDSFAQKEDENYFDLAVVLTNDTDICGAIEIVKNNPNKKAILLTPTKTYYTDHKIRQLSNTMQSGEIPKNKIPKHLAELFKAPFGEIRELRQSHLSTSQFPDEIIVSPTLTIKKPITW